jgi:hypothetical protein
MRTTSVTQALAVLALAAGSVLAVGPSASADPVHDVAVPVTCDNGHTYDMYVWGNGHFTPAHDADSNTVLVPTHFGEFHGVVTNEGGDVLDEFTEPAESKGNSAKQRGTSVNCTYVFEGQEFSDELGEVVNFRGEGSVSGFITPAK